MQHWGSDYEACSTIFSLVHALEYETSIKIDATIGFNVVEIQLELYHGIVFTIAERKLWNGKVQSYDANMHFNTLWALLGQNASSLLWPMGSQTREQDVVW